MPEFHSEPFLFLAGLTHNSVLITWGAFYFRIRSSDGSFKLVDDDDLKHVHPPRHESIGARSEPYGDARVEVFDQAGSMVSAAMTSNNNHCWISGLQPDTEYTYRVWVNGEEWAGGERRDWISADNRMGLQLTGNRYTNRFRTHPNPTQPAVQPFTFAIIGDFGTGVKKKDRPQQKIAEALKTAADNHDIRLILTTGDNIYAGRKFFGLPIGSEGDEDDDWFFTFYQPYRYIINRVPVYPTIGNHDADESEERDDRTQLIDNFYLKERLAGEEAAGRASVGPGMFYRFRFGSQIEFVCIDTSIEPDLFGKKRLFQHPKHVEFLKLAFPEQNQNAFSWRIPFSHHPPFSAGPRHHNTKDMMVLLDLFQRSGVRVVFSGHEHNFQHNKFQNIHYLVTGAAGKLRDGKPDKFDDAHTVSWCAANHFLLVTIDKSQMKIKPISALIGNALHEIERLDPNETAVNTPIVIG